MRFISRHDIPYKDRVLKINQNPTISKPRITVRSGETQLSRIPCRTLNIEAVGRLVGGQAWVFLHAHKLLCECSYIHSRM